MYTSSEGMQIVPLHYATMGSSMGGSQHVRRSRQEKNRGFGASEAPDSGRSGLTGRLEAVSRMKQSATLTRRPPTEFRGEQGSNQVPITVEEGGGARKASVRASMA